MAIDVAAFRERLSTARFLVVDDRPNFSKTMTNLLETICKFKNKERSLFAVGNSKDSLRLLLQKESVGEPIDMMFIDLHMPDIHGLDLLRTIRNAKNDVIRNIPIMVVTAVDDKKILMETVHEGTDGFLLKPFTAKELMLKMNPILHGHWAKERPNRKPSKRRQVRLDTSRLDIMVEAYFKSGDLKKCRIVDISQEGARIYLEGSKNRYDIEIPQGLFFNEDYTVETITIPPVPGIKEKESIVEVRSLPEINLNGFDEIMVPLKLQSGFPDADTARLWRQWIDLAKRENLQNLEKGIKPERIVS